MMAGKRKVGGAPEGAATSRRRKKPAASRSPEYRLLALDLDGTLLNHEGVANDTDVAAIRKLRARGIKVTIITGRLYSGTRETADLLGIDGPVGCADGSHIVNVKNDRTLFHRGIRGRAADRLRASLERNDLVAFLFVLAVALTTLSMVKLVQGARRRAMADG